jgi:osmotically-inducible protein OsmY
MHRHDQNMGRGRSESYRNRDDERRGQTSRGREDDEWEERGYETRSGEHHERQHSRWLDADDDRRRDEGRRHEEDRVRSSGPRDQSWQGGHGMQGQGFDEGRRFGGRGFYDRDRDYVSRGGQGGYGGYGGAGEHPRGMGGRDTSWRDREEEMRRFDRGHDQPQDYGSRSIGFRGRMGEDYGYGGFGHMGQSDMYGDRHMGEDDRRGMGRGMDRGFGGTDRGYGMERYSDRYSHDRNYGGMGMRQGYGGMDRNYGEQQRMTQGGQYGTSQYGQERGMGSQAPMRGKGPKNYSRSDDRIREEVCELLEDADLDASEIDVKVRGGEVTLEGTVQDRWAKREAEDVIAHARGVKDCHNQLKVQSRDQQQQAQGRQGQQQTQGRSNGNPSGQDKQQRTS